MMATQCVPRSLERTSLYEHLIVYFLVVNKSNKELSIIERANLPPTLGCGELTLHQRIEFENENQEIVKGKILYIRRYRCFRLFSQMICLLKFRFNIDTNRENCISAQHRFLEKRKQEKSGRDENPIDKTNDTIESTYSHDDNTMETSLNTVEDTQIEFYLKEINELKIKVSQQTEKIKKQKAEIKRLKATSIGIRSILFSKTIFHFVEIPNDEQIRQFLTLIGKKAQTESSPFEYQGDLKEEADDLGVSHDILQQILKTKLKITKKARRIFKLIIPDKYLRVKMWTNLPQNILVKEKTLIGMTNIESINNPIFLSFKNFFNGIMEYRTMKNRKFIRALLDYYVIIEILQSNENNPVIQATRMTRMIHKMKINNFNSD